MHSNSKAIFTWIVIVIVALILWPLVTGLIALAVKLILFALLIAGVYWVYRNFIAGR